MKELTEAFEAKQLKDKQAFLEAMKILNKLELNGKLIVESTDKKLTSKPYTSLEPIKSIETIPSRVTQEKPIRQDIVRNDINLGEGVDYTKEEQLKVINTGPTNIVDARKMFKDNKYIQMVKTEELIEFFQLLRELTDMAIDDGHDQATVDYLIDIIDNQINMFRGEDNNIIEDDDTSLFEDNLEDNNDIEPTTIKKSFTKAISGRINVDESR